MKNPFIKSCIILMINYSTYAYCFDDIFYETLTYPNNEWSGEDFGRLPSLKEKELLKRNIPSTFIAKDQCLPMDFYTQYLKFLRVKGNDNKKLSRAWLKSHERDLGIDFVLSKKIKCISENKPPLYAYSWNEDMRLADGTRHKLRILKYSHVFFKSGLPTDMPLMSRFLSLGSQDIWHYLGIRGAVFYMLREGKKSPLLWYLPSTIIFVLT